MTDDYAQETSTGAVMDESWTYNKQITVQCFGDNPALQSAQSKNDKNIAGLINNTAQNEITFYNYTNVEAITIEPEVETEIASLAFTAAQTTTVKIMHEFLFDMIRDLTINGGYEIRYYLDYEPVTYKPRESLSAIVATTDIPQPEGEEPTEPVQADIEPVEISITRDLFYIVKNVTPNVRHIWQVKIITHGIESAEIRPQNAHVTLEGQRLYGEEYFDGYIEIKENISAVSIGGLDIIERISESAAFSFEEIPFCVGADNIPVYVIDALELKNISEAPQMFIESLSLKLHTEDGYQRITEDGGRRVSE